MTYQESLEKLKRLSEITGRSPEYLWKEYFEDDSKQVLDLAYSEIEKDLENLKKEKIGETKEAIVKELNRRILARK